MIGSVHKLNSYGVYQLVTSWKLIGAFIRLVSFRTFGYNAWKTKRHIVKQSNFIFVESSVHKLNSYDLLTVTKPKTRYNVVILKYVKLSVIFNRYIISYPIFLLKPSFNY